jgi:hypothetical protein
VVVACELKLRDIDWGLYDLLMRPAGQPIGVPGDLRPTRRL